MTKTPLERVQAQQWRKEKDDSVILGTLLLKKLWEQGDRMLPRIMLTSPIGAIAKVGTITYRRIA